MSRQRSQPSSRGFLPEVVRLLREGIALAASDARRDRHALLAPDHVAGSIPTLAGYLVEGATTERESVRSIFRWVAGNIAYDTEGYRLLRWTLPGTDLDRVRQGHFPIGAVLYLPLDTRPETVLRTRRTICLGYARLFQALAWAARLQAEVVTGTVTGDWGEGLRQGLHAWNAVRLAGRWRTLDVTWAAGHLARGAFVRCFRGSFFLPEPWRLRRTHTPDQARWRSL